MAPALRSRVQFGIAAALSFFVATNGFDVLARMSVSQEPFAKATSESFYYAAIQPVGTLLLLAPFIAIAWISIRVERKASAVSAWLLFVVSVSALGWFYFEGYQGAQQAMLQERWTAAALSVGMLPFTSAPVPLLAALVGGLIVWK
jgi:hypothetical protein